MSTKQQVKVVIRTRPTPNFCSKNLNIDPVNSVSTHDPSYSKALHDHPIQHKIQLIHFFLFCST